MDPRHALRSSLPTRPVRARVAGLTGLLAVGASVACSATPDVDVVRPAAPERTSVAAAALSGPVTRSQVIANAQQWVTAQLQYCQSANGQPDYDTSCSSTCMRQSNPAWDPYRSDCSGFISWAWELPAPGLVTGDFAPIGSASSMTIPCADMKPGDAANRYPNKGHIVLFKQWVTPGTEAIFMEEPGCSSSTPYAKEFQSAVTCSGDTVNITYEGDTFTAIRYPTSGDDAADAGSGGDSGSGSASSSGGSGSGSGSGSASSSGGSGSSSGSGAGPSSSGAQGGGTPGDDAGAPTGPGGGSSGGSAPPSSGGGAAPGAGSGSGGGGSAPPASADAGGVALGDVPESMPVGGAATCDVAAAGAGGGGPAEGARAHGGLVLLALAGLGLARQRRRQ